MFGKKHLLKIKKRSKLIINRTKYFKNENKYN